MATKRAKTLTPEQLDFALRYIAETSRTPLRDYVILLLSFKGALRAQEIAGLDWEDVTDVQGKIGQPGHAVPVFTVPSDIAKKGHARIVPMHPALVAALGELQRQQGPEALPRNAVVRGLFQERISPNVLQKYMSRLYGRMGFQGASSHSGRRTFVTAAIRKAGEHACSIRDVQDVVGHKDIETTEKYIELSPHIGALVGSL